MKQYSVAAPAQKRDSPAKTWARALERTASIARNPKRVFPAVIQESAERFGDSPALLSDSERLTYRGLAQRANRYARWAIDQGVRKGDTVCLLMPNRPEYMAAWLGITSAGGVAALLNTALPGLSLAHCINSVTPKHVITDAALTSSLESALPHVTTYPSAWIQGAGRSDFPRIDSALDRYSGEILTRDERPPVTIADRALCIFTSGTTGLPKAANVSHGRVMQWALWFAGLMNTEPADRMYNCLPMYHSVGGVQAPGALLVAGGSVVIKRKFSARHFWDDIVRWDCSLLQYIGEFCRYLLNADPASYQPGHRIRIACGNGLRPDIWNEFKQRFGIPRILESYAATEGVLSLFNVEGEPGSVGRIPFHLAHRFPVTLVKFDVASGSPFRNSDGRCVPCADDEPGEAIAPVLLGPADFANGFEGYTATADSDKKILRNVLCPGDSWFRTGDLMRKNARGFFYFVDRIGDTFRWKGENVATSEVEEALCGFPGVRLANVFGVKVPGTDGRACMAALVIGGDLDLEAFRAFLTGRLPGYARPLFLRICGVMEVTSTFKYTKAELVRQGYNPAATTDAVYFNDPESSAFIPLDSTIYERIHAGRIRWRPSRGQAFQPVVFDELRDASAALEVDIADGPVVPSVTPVQIRDHLARYDFTQPMALEDVASDLEQMMRNWHVQVTHPRYLGLFNPSVSFSGILADTIVAMYNPQLATWRTSPAANEIERHTLAWLSAKFGLPACTLANFTTGGSEANLSAVVVALTRGFPGYGENGIFQSRARPAIYLTRDAHTGFNKIAHITGIGREALRVVASDSDLRLDPEDLARQVSADRKAGFAPFLVVGTAGTTTAGSIDPLPDLARFCSSENLWFHVDAAWGGAAILSQRLRRHLAGIELADSITCDAHKWFSVPMGAGMFFCRHPDNVAEAFRTEASFMPAETPGPVDPYRTSIQWSRRFIGLKLFMALAHQGESGYAAAIENQARIGDVLRESLRHTGWSIVNSTPLPLVCFTRDGLDAGRLVSALHERQIAWMSQVQLNSGPPVLRACITSARTTEAQIDWMVREMNELL